jgi:hypothetical protein
MENTVKGELNINLFADRLRGELNCEITTLHLLDNATEIDKYKSGFILKNGVIETVIQSPPVEFLIQREITKSFKSVMASLQDFLDKLLAGIELINETHEIPRGTTEIGFQAMINTKFLEHLQRIATNRALSIPGKLKRLLGDDEKWAPLKEILQNYFDIRNAFEHHKGMAKKGRVLKYKKLAVSTTNGQLVTSLPFLASPGEEILFNITLEDVIYDEGNNIHLTREQLNGVILFLQLQGISQILEAARSIPPNRNNK